MYRRALKGKEKVLGVEHPEILVSVSNLASILQDQTTKQYYKAVASHRDMRCTAHRPFETEKLFDSADLPAMLSLCISSVVDDYTDVFGLANRELSLSYTTFLVDEDFNVVALIDLNFILSGPLHVVASLPHRPFSELDIDSSDLGVMQGVKNTGLLAAESLAEAAD